jgi:hypothetical protein
LATRRPLAPAISHSTMPMVLPLFTIFPTADNFSFQTGLRKLIFNSRVVNASPLSKVLAQAAPIARSARSHKTPPCKVPIGLKCWGPAPSSTWDSPGSIETTLRPKGNRIKPIYFFEHEKRSVLGKSSPRIFGSSSRGIAADLRTSLGKPRAWRRGTSLPLLGKVR